MTSGFGSSSSSSSRASSRASTRPLNAKRAPQLAQVQVTLWRGRPRSGLKEEAALIVSVRGCGAAPLTIPLSPSDVEILQKSGAEVEQVIDDSAVVACQE